MPGVNDMADYTMVLPTQHYRIDDHRVALESAFAHHLRLMRSKVSTIAGRLVIVSPAMATSQYQASKQSLEILDEHLESITFDAPYSFDEIGSKAAKLKLFMPLMRRLHARAKQSICVHAGLSWDWMLPTEFASLLFAVLHRRRTVFIVDIDYRKSAWMSYKNGSWSLKSYLVCRYVYDSIRSMQVWVAAHNYSLVMLKGRKMAQDFGHGRPNVKDFLDAAHSESNIIDQSALDAKLATLLNPAQPLRLTYFGRITAYKGIDSCIRAVAAARAAGANVTLDIIGGGEQSDFCRNLALELNAGEFITFHGPKAFGPEFFNFLYQFHILLAAPLREDTPRSALDGMAAGMPFLAYDTYYYAQLAESGAGTTVPWLNEQAMTAAIVALASDRARVAAMVESAVAFAHLNTQEIWLDRRLQWTMDSVQSAS